MAKRSNNLTDYQSDINRLIVNVNQDLSDIDQNIVYLQAIINNLDYWNNKCCKQHHQRLLNQLLQRNEKLKSKYLQTHQLAINSMKRQKKQRDQFGVIKRSKRGGLDRRSLYKKFADNHDRIGCDNNMQMVHPQQTQQQIMMNFGESRLVNYNQDRLEAVTRIASELQDINKMTTDLAVMVHDQGEVMGVINDNIDRAKDNMDGVIGELQKYLARMSANEMLMIKVFALIIFLAIFFAIFVA